MARRGLIGMVFAALSALGCAAAPEVGATNEPDVRVEWIGHTVIPLGEDDRLGGLSDLTCGDGRWFAITDHPREPRLVELQVEVDAAAGRVEAGIVGWSAIDAGAGDGESVVWLGNGRFAAGFESPGALAFLDEKGHLLGRPALPAEVAGSMRANRQLEALAVREGTDHRRELWVGIETALTIDGPEASSQEGALCRVLVMDAQTGAALRQNAYRTLPAPVGLVGPVFNSLVSFAALDDGRVLALERSLELIGGYGIALRVLSPTGAETDVTGMADLADDASLVPLPTTTIFERRGLNTLGPGNVEGVAIGPAIDDEIGGRLLVLVSDDNFGREGQRGVLVIAMRLLIGGATSTDAGPGPSAPR